MEKDNTCQGLRPNGEPCTKAAKKGLPYCARHSRMDKQKACAKSNSRMKRLRTMPYAEYLQTAHWRKLRDAKRKESGMCCEVCNSTERIEIHHRTYHRGSESMADLIAVCHACHETHHKNKGSLKPWGTKSNASDPMASSK